MFYKSTVEKILTSNGSAAGISLKGGKDIQADYVISAADMKTTVYGMLDGKYVEPLHEELFKNVKLFPSMLQVAFGTGMDFSDEPDSLGEMFKLQEPLVTGNQKNEWLMVKNYSFDPTLAPSGKTVVLCGINAYDYSYWEQLYKDKKAYNEEKNRIAEFMADFMEEKHPGFKASIEMTDVATPVTFARYTGNWKGSFMTWVISPAISKRYRMIPKTLPGLKNFWLSGMWVMPPGGLPSGVKSSRDVIQLICRQDRKKFITRTN
jgi:phytoene dehydrogenase-like protein